MPGELANVRKSITFWMKQPFDWLSRVFVFVTEKVVPYQGEAPF